MRELGGRASRNFMIFVLRSRLRGFEADRAGSRNAALEKREKKKTCFEGRRDLMGNSPWNAKP